MRHSRHSLLIALLLWAMLLAQGAGVVHRVVHLDRLNPKAATLDSASTHDHGVAHPCALLDVLGGTPPGCGFGSTTTALNLPAGHEPRTTDANPSRLASRLWSTHAARAPPSA
ncbi:MAG: hypothetical protein ACK4FF_01560 [Limnobacter sp.]|uniref:hypothetical protein n=1 Tax=Limnobacter sp. TaxID=2003368 RepID=UPI00391D527E